MKLFLKGGTFFILSLGAISAALIRWQIKEYFFVNIIGCFLIGFINAFPFSKRSKLLFGFAFCGSLTTFSGWIFSLFVLINKGLYKLVFLNSILIVLLGLFAIYFGDLLAKKINRLT